MRELNTVEVDHDRARLVELEVQLEGRHLTAVECAMVSDRPIRVTGQRRAESLEEVRGPVFLLDQSQHAAAMG